MCRRSLKLTEDVLVAVQVKLVIAEFHRVASVLREQDAVPDDDAHRQSLSLLGRRARTDCDDFALIQLLARVGKKNSGRSLQKKKGGDQGGGGARGSLTRGGGGGAPPPPPPHA